MKKSLIAVAALAAVGAASAESSVTLYGLADVGVGYSQVKVGGNKFKSIGSAYNGGPRGGLQGSRLGVKGVEDLGNGLSAVFNYELGFQPNNGAFTANGSSGTGFGRRAVVGLQGAFGSVLLGRDYTPVFNLMGASNADGNSSFDTGYYEGTGVNGFIQPGFQARTNGAFYAGNFSGFGVQAFAGYNQQQTNLVLPDGTTTGNVTTRKYRGYGLGLSYANGPFMVGVAGQQFRTDLMGVAQPKETDWVVGGSYDFGAAKLYANYTNFKGNAAYNYGKYQQANIGVGVPFGAASLVAEYGRNRYTNYGVTSNGNDFMIGANYAFSKRTDVYARLAQSDDLKASDINAAQNVRRATIGLRHKF